MYRVYHHPAQQLTCTRQGFRIDPIEKLEAVMKEMRSFHSLFSRSPMFGVDFTVEAEAPSLEVGRHSFVLLSVFQL